MRLGFQANLAPVRREKVPVVTGLSFTPYFVVFGERASAGYDDAVQPDTADVPAQVIRKLCANKRMARAKYAQYEFVFDVCLTSTFLLHTERPAGTQTPGCGDLRHRAETCSNLLFVAATPVSNAVDQRNMSSGPQMGGSSRHSIRISSGISMYHRAWLSLR
jgi:hypothetical protein